MNENQRSARELKMKCPLKLHTGSIQGKVRVQKIMFLSTDQPAKLLNHWGKNAEVETIIENKAETRRKRLWEKLQTNNTSRETKTIVMENTIKAMRKEGLPKWFSGKESTCLRRCGFYHGVRKIPWRRKWQPTPAFLPGKSHRQRILAGYSPWHDKESDTT